MNPVSLQEQLLVQHPYPQLVSLCSQPRFESICYFSIWKLKAEQELGVTDQYWSWSSENPQAKYLRILSMAKAIPGSEVFIDPQLCLTRSARDGELENFRYFKNFLDQLNITIDYQGPLKKALVKNHLDIVQEILPYWDLIDNNILRKAALSGNLQLFSEIASMYPSSDPRIVIDSVSISVAYAEEVAAILGININLDNVQLTYQSTELIASSGTEEAYEFLYNHLDQFKSMANRNLVTIELAKSGNELLLDQFLSQFSVDPNIDALNICKGAIRGNHNQLAMKYAPFVANIFYSGLLQESIIHRCYPTIEYFSNLLGPDLLRTDNTNNPDILEKCVEVGDTIFIDHFGLGQFFDQDDFLVTAAKNGQVDLVEQLVESSSLQQLEDALEESYPYTSLVITDRIDEIEAPYL